MIIKCLRPVFILLCTHGGFDNLQAQSDTIGSIAFGGFLDVAFSPETGAQFLAVGQVAFDVSRNYLESRMSQNRTAISYSSKNQFGFV